MKNKVKEQVKIDIEILSTLPKNNNKNKILYIDKVKEVLEKYSVYKNIIIEEMKERNDSCVTFQKNNEIGLMEEELKKIMTKIKLLNSINSSYEKLDFDKIIYSISKYYKGNLTKVNNDILKAINIFENAGIKLKKEQFYYSTQAMTYMTEILKEPTNPDFGKLEILFEKLYWQNPNIITHIELNFRDLYHKHEKVFDSYVEKLKKDLISENETLYSVVNDYHKLKRKYDDAITTDIYTVFYRFKNGELNVKDYNDDKIKKIYRGLMSVDDNKDYNDNIVKLNHTVNEYQNYLKYKFIIDDMKNLFHKNIDITSKNKIKEINKLEQDLEKYSSKGSIFKKIKRNSINIEESIETLKKLYEELDNTVFKEKLMENVSNESKVIDLLGVGVSYYVYLVKCYKEKMTGILEEDILNNYFELQNYLLSPYHTIINNLYVFKDYDLKMIISDKYKLDNLNITMSMLEEISLDTLIEETKLIVDHHKFTNLNGITLNQIDSYCKFDNILCSKK